MALQRATEQIDVALVAAVYRTDADGMPLDADLVEHACVRATAAQCQYILAVNDDAEVKREYASTSVGGDLRDQSSGDAGQGAAPDRPQALAILRVSVCSHPHH